MGAYWGTRRNVLALAAVDAPLDLMSGGCRLAGVLTTSAAHAPPRGCVLLLHGLFSHHAHNFAPALAARLASDTGLAVYRFSFRGPADAGWVFPGLAGDMEDVNAARSMLAERGLVTACIVGHSKGANVALMIAAASSEPLPVVALAPRYHMDGMLTALFAAELPRLTTDDSFTWSPRGGGCVVITRAIADAVRALDMAAVIDAVPALAPVLIVHGTADRTIPHTDADAFASRRRGCRVVKLRAGHTLNDARRALLDEVAAFVTTHAGGGSPQRHDENDRP